MSEIQTAFLQRCIDTLEKSYTLTMIDLKKKYYDELTAIFSAYCPKAEIWAYGSRRLFRMKY